MTPEQIKRAKRLAEILDLITHDVHTMDGIKLPITENGDEFNPEQDKALLWDLMVEYKKELFNCVLFKHQSPSELPAALIDCVIEINGGYGE